MNKIFVLTAFIVFCIAMPTTMHAVRTGQTRREGMQAHRIALKQARKLSLASVRMSCPESKTSLPSDPYAAINIYWRGELPERVTQEDSHCKCLVFTGSRSQRLIMWTMIACLLMPMAHGAAADDKMQTIVHTAASLSHTLALGGPGAVAGMQVAMQAAVHSIKFDGMLDGKLGDTADKFGRLMHEYHEYEATDPVKARLALSGAMIAAKGAVGLIAGGLATAPEGGVGAIPGALAGLSKGLKDEIIGIVAGEAIHQADKIVDHKIESWIQQGIQKGAPIFMRLDYQLTDEQAFNWSLLVAMAGLSSGEFTAVINRLGHMELNIFKASLNAIKTDTEQAPLRSLRQELAEQFMDPLHGAIEHGAMHDLKHNFFESDRMKRDAAPAEISLPLQTLPLVHEKSYDFIGDAKRIIDHQAFERWKTESSDLLHLPKMSGLDFINQQQHEMMSRPDWQYEGAAGNTWYNEQQRKKVFGF